MTPMARVDALRKITLAWNTGTPRQQRAAAVFLAVMGVPAIAGLISLVVSAVR
jgi:hypothetical protein